MRLQVLIALVALAGVATVAFFRGTADAQPLPPPVPVPAPEEPAVDVPTLRLPLFSGASLDPHNTQNPQSFTLCAALYDTLYTYAPGPEPVIKPSLAEGFPTVSKDGLTWTIKLRKDAKCHNSSRVFGEEKTSTLDAHDVVASLKRLSSRGNDTSMYWLIAGVIKGLDDFGARFRSEENAGSLDVEVEGVTAPDDNTVQLKLTRPFGPLLSVLAHPCTSIIPRQAIAAYGDELGRRAVGSGPYRLHAFSADGDLLVLKRFDGYWGEKPAFERVMFQNADTADNLIALFSEGKFSRLELSEPMLEAMAPKGKPGPALMKLGVMPEYSDDWSLAFLCFNMEDKIWGALDDDGRALRKAVTLALDREKIARECSLGERLARGGLEGMIPGLEFGEIGVEHNFGKCDAKAAKDALDASKYKGGIDPDTKEALRLDLVLPRPRMFNMFEFERPLSTGLQAALKPLGITVNVKYLPGASYRNAIRSDNGHAFITAWFLDTPDPQNYMQLLYGANAGTEDEYGNHARYKGPEFDKTYKELEALLPTPETAAKRREIVQAMVKQLVLDRPIIPLIVRRLCHVRSPKVEWAKEPAATYNELRHIKPGKAD